MSVRFAVSGDALIRTTGVPDESNFTICGWARQINNTANWSIIAAMDEATLTNFAYVGYDGTGTALGVFGGGSFLFAATPVIDTWYFWAMSCAGPSTGQLIGYWAPIADLALSTTTNGDTNAYTGTEFRIGNNGFDERFDGRIAAVKIWDAVLTPAEILAERWTYVPQRTANLHAWLPMADAVAADNYKDRSGNARDFAEVGSLSLADGPPISWGAPSTYMRNPTTPPPPPPDGPVFRLRAA